MGTVAPAPEGTRHALPSPSRRASLLLLVACSPRDPDDATPDVSADPETPPRSRETATTTRFQCGDLLIDAP